MNDRTRIPGLMVLLMLGCLAVSALRNPWADKTAEMEFDALTQAFGLSRAEQVVQRAARWYRIAVEDTGMFAWCRETFTGRPDTLERSGEFAHGPWAEGIHVFGKRLDQVFDHLKLIFRRVSTLVFCLPAILPVLFACLVDGWVRRRIRQTGFAYASPLMQRLAFRVIQATSIMILLVLFWPATAPIGLAPSLSLVIAVAMGVVLTHSQKRF